MIWDPDRCDDPACCPGEPKPLDLPGTDTDGLPRAVACRWHGAHYDGEICDASTQGDPK